MHTVTSLVHITHILLAAVFGLAAPRTYKYAQNSLNNIKVVQINRMSITGSEYQKSD